MKIFFSRFDGFLFLLLLAYPLFAEQVSNDLPQTNLVGQVSQTEDSLGAQDLQVDEIDRVKFTVGDRRFVDDEEANDLLTPLERYASRTQVNIFRRTETLFFIGVPFAIFINYTLKSSFSLFSAMAAAIEDGPPSVSPSRFNYFHENTLANTIDPFYVYTWTSNIFWPLTVALNDVIERTTTDAYTLKQKRNIRRWRFDADFMHTDF